MAGVYTVSQINAYIKNLFVRDYALSNICVKGEVSNCKYHTSGHIYFTLKDAGGALSCVMFARERESLSFRLADGQEVEVRGQISVFERSGSYQLYARRVSLSGRGELYERYEALKEALSELGLFDEMYKKPIPAYARRIGIVTSETGAVIQDIQNVARRRNPYVELILYPALVQGPGAKESIVRGIRTLDRMGLDVLIVGRGGGSIEDLWAFNEECVARAVFDAHTPVISAVGHETDFTIADFAADLRAPTPSAAAELAVFDYQAFLEELSGYQSALLREVYGRLQMEKKRLQEYALRLKLRSPAAVLQAEQQRLLDVSRRMRTCMQNRMAAARLRLDSQEFNLRNLMQARSLSARHRLELLSGRLDGLSPLKRLSGGYAWLSDEKDGPIRSAGQVKQGDKFWARLSDGKLLAEVKEIRLLDPETESSKGSAGN